MAKLEDDDEKNKDPKVVEAHITSLSVLRTHRKLGIATKLMRATHHQMVNYFGCTQCSLRVRVTNQAAIGLYTGVLKYEIRSLDAGYYADGEDAHDMCIFFNKVKGGEESKDTAEESKVVEGDVGGGVDKFAEQNVAKDQNRPQTAPVKGKKGKKGKATGAAEALVTQSVETI